MQSWRINTIFDNRSQKSLASSGAGIGATVVRAERSLEVPVKFAKGESQRILNMLGEPTVNNPELLEAIEYNQSYPLWLASPSVYGYSGGLLIGPEGTELLGDGVKGDTPLDLESITLYKKLIVTEGTSNTNFTANTFQYANYVDTSLKVYKNGILLDTLETKTGTPNTIENMPAEDPVVHETEPSTYDATTGEVNITFVDEFVGIDDVISISYDTDLSAFNCLLTCKGANSSYIKTKVVKGDNDSFKLSFQIKNIEGSYVEHLTSPLEFSVTEGTLNGFGINISIGEVFDDHNFFVAHYKNGAAYTTFVEDTDYTEITGGYHDIKDVSVTTGYNFFKKTRTYATDVFFDATLDENVPTLFSTLRTGYQKYSSYVLPMPNQNVEDTLAATLTATDRGLSYYWGWFKILNLYSKKGNVIGIPMGEVAKAHADSITKSFGGLAIAWTNENGVGGQLTSGRILKAVYDPSEDELESLDTARINAIIYDPTFGAMITSRRTSIADLSDYSFIDYSGIVDYILKNISSKVLPYQIVKLNDASHRNIVRTKTEAILEPMTLSPYNVIDSYAVKCDSQNNNDIVRQEEKFKLDVAVKVTPKSRTIVFTFINTPQTSTVDAMLV